MGGGVPRDPRAIDMRTKMASRGILGELDAFVQSHWLPRAAVAETDRADTKQICCGAFKGSQAFR